MVTPLDSRISTSFVVESISRRYTKQDWQKLTYSGIQKGPIVRVTPYEVHIRDPDWYDVLYCAPNKGARDKYKPSAHMTGTPLGSMFASSVTHRSRLCLIICS